MENVSSEAEYWAARDARDQEMRDMMENELARKARQRKTSPWRLAATFVVACVILALGYALLTSLYINDAVNLH